jgi:Tfp pilus assembly protein PilV
MHALREPLIFRGRVTLTGLSRDASGITLIEALICSFVVGIGVVALTLMLARGQATIAGEGDNRVAVYLAQQKIEKCRNLTYQQVDATGSACLTTDYFNPDLSAGASTAYFYKRTGAVDLVCGNDYTATTGCATSPGQAKRITVTVQSTPKEARQVVLTAVLSNR